MSYTNKDVSHNLKMIHKFWRLKKNNNLKIQGFAYLKK